MQVVPQGISSVNGSDVNMGCASPPAGIGDMKLCGTPLADIDNATCGNYSGSESYVVDCNSPAIDTSTSNWASQLVTVRKNKNDDINFNHVLLTFYFDTAMSPTAIELDLFLCPEWNIGAPFITVYAEESKNTCGLVFSYSSVETEDIDFLVNYTPNKSSCDSLSTVSIPVQEHSRSPYFTWHIVVSFANQPDIEWVHVGEVIFVDVPAVCPNPFSSVDIPGKYTDMIMSAYMCVYIYYITSLEPFSSSILLESDLVNFACFEYRISTSCKDNPSHLHRVDILYTYTMEIGT